MLGWHLTIWSLGLEELLHDLSPRNEEKQYGRQIHPFSFQTVKLKKDFTRVSRVALLFDFNLKYRSSYATFKLLAQFLFGSALKME